jgi:hypothetical protein
MPANDDAWLDLRPDVFEEFKVHFSKWCGVNRLILMGTHRTQMRFIANVSQLDVKLC